MQTDPLIRFLNDHGIAVEMEFRPPGWGQRRVRVFRGPNAQFLIKTTPAGSPLRTLPEQLLTELFDELHRFANHLVLPVKLGGRHMFEFEGQTLMLYPWVGHRDAWEHFWGIKLDEHLSFLATVTNELGRIPQNLVDRLIAADFKMGFSRPRFLASLDTCRPLLGERLREMCLEVASLKQDTWWLEAYSKLSHTDLDKSNIVRIVDGRSVAVDIENMRVGNEYVDLIYMLVSNGLDQLVVGECVTWYQRHLTSPPVPLNANTALLGIDLAILWLCSISQSALSAAKAPLEISLEGPDDKHLEDVFGNLSKTDFNLYEAVAKLVPKFRRGLGGFLGYLLSQSSRRSISPAATRTTAKAESQDILVVHHIVPEPDINSGDLRLYEILQILAAAGHRITFCASRKSDERSIPKLTALGITCVIDDDANGFAHLLGSARFHCAIVSQYWTYRKYIERLRFYQPNCAVILDTVDLHFVRLEREAELNPTLEAKQQAAQAHHEEWAAIHSADTVWVVTGKEQHLLRRGGAELVDVVSNVHQLNDDPPPFDQRTGIIFLGYYTHRPNADAVHFFMREIYPPLRQRLPTLTVTFAGAAPPPEFNEYTRKYSEITVTGYVEDHRALLCSNRIGIAPLRYGAGMKGKIGEYLACGLPCVTTSIGAEGMGLKDGWQVLREDDPVAFAQAIVRLYHDRDLWRQLSDRGQQYIRQQLSRDAISPNVLSGIQAAMEARKRTVAKVCAFADEPKVTQQWKGSAEDLGGTVRQLQARLAEQEQQLRAQAEKLQWHREKHRQLRAKLDGIYQHPIMKAYRWARQMRGPRHPTESPPSN